MTSVQFHKSEKGQGDEDWFYLVVDPKEQLLVVEHSWSHSAGTAVFREGKKQYSISEFAEQKPNQYRWFLEWLSKRLSQ